MTPRYGYMVCRGVPKPKTIPVPTIAILDSLWCHTVKLFHSKNIGFGTIFLHYQYFLIAYKNHDSKIFNILGIQHKNQMRGQEADDTRKREKN